MYKKLIKNSQPFGKKFQKTVGGIFLTHTVHMSHVLLARHWLGLKTGTYSSVMAGEYSKQVHNGV